MTVEEARAAYFAVNGFSLASYDARWVRVRIAGLPIAFPNVRSRRRAIRFHDLHHVATGYATTLRGESEMGAWEIASSFGDRGSRYWAAWLLNFGAFTFGLVLAPRRVYRAFLRGRGCSSVYRIGWTEELLGLELDELRHRLGLDLLPRRATWTDRLAFACVAIVATPGAIVIALAAALGRSGTATAAAVRLIMGRPRAARRGCAAADPMPAT